MRGTNLGVFAVDASGGQLTWSAWPGQEVVVEVAGHTLAAAASAPAWLRRRGRAPLRLSALPGGPGTLRIAGLRPGAHYPLRVRCPGSAALPLDTSLSMTTLAAPPGPALSRFATISDLHVGERSFGALSTIEEQVPLP
ncbi:MAG: hypothetical protein ACR2NJ_02140, partial [Acidimicrobiales bacterium]